MQQQHLGGTAEQGVQPRTGRGCAQPGVEPERRNERQERQRRRPARAAGGGGQQQYRWQHCAGQHAGQILGAGEAVAETDRQGTLAGLLVGGTVAQVVDDQDGGGEQAGAEADAEHQRRQCQRLQVVGGADRHRTEEHQHQQVAEAEVAERPRAAGVADRGRHAGNQQRRQRPSGSHYAGHPQDGSAGKHHQRAAEHLPWRNQTCLRHPRRADPIRRVGAVAGVRPVVVQVAAHLNQQRAGQRHQRPRRRQ